MTVSSSLADLGRRGLAALLVVQLVGLPLPAAAQSPAASGEAPETELDPGWPREIERGGNRLVYYQPQIDEWKSYREIRARYAFTLTPAGGEAVVGVASMRARTQVDKAARTVAVRDIEVVDVRFPALDAAAEPAMDRLAESLLPTAGMIVSLDRVVGAMERSEEVVAAPDGIRNEPPPIFSATGPAILLFVDGEPVYAPIEGTRLQFVVNTNWDLFWDEASARYFLLDENLWLTSASLGGTWTATRQLPAEMAKLPAGEEFAAVRAMVPPPPSRVAAPKVHYTDRPAELVRFDGKPMWATIAGTRLVYGKNTESDLFVHGDTQQYYFLVSGRWFRSGSLAGPWSFAGGDLPADFARIPVDGPKGHVLASVPGTPEAADAVLLARIPTSAVVNRAEAEKAVRVTYDGEPKFAPIETTELSYATNSAEQVIRYGDLYYLCFQGVWFRSTSPTGPWKTADSVPAAIYTIPASSPMHNVTYVTVVDATPTTVECNHTSGYLGVFVVGVAVGAILVHGSGWYYPPYFYRPPGWYYPIYRPYPYSYGYHAVYNPWTGGYRYGARVYGPYGAAARAGWYNPATGRYGRAATVQTPWGGRTVAATYNPWTGTRAAHAGGWSPYGSWGSTAVQRGSDWAVSNRVTTAQGTVRRTTTSGGQSVTTVRGRGGETVRIGRDADNNLYAGKDGNVYRREQGGDWSKHDSGGWNAVEPRPAKPSARPATGTAPVPRTTPAAGEWRGSELSRELEREASGRARGAQLSERAAPKSTRSARPSRRPPGG
jgi:hypothetical protein